MSGIISAITAFITTIILFFEAIPVAWLPTLTVDAAKKLYVKVKNNTQFLQLKSIFAKYPGDNNLVIYFEDSGSVIKSDSNHRVCICNGIFDELCTKLGYDNVKIK